MNVYNTTDLPEVEIISLLEDQLPRYRLRADTIFGYDHDDWLHTPLIPPDFSIDLTTEQIEETLKYFLLSADRVGQMTKTYHDIDAVTRLLEEKERDLELAARIGQSLLKKNKTLSERSQFLEEQVEHIREEVSQLRHDLLMKDELLQFYTNAVEESNGDSAGSTPVRQNDAHHAVPNNLPLDSLQKKLKDLEEENIVLRSEAFNLETETISYEEKEQQLVTDCVKELRDANLQIASISEELAKKSEDASRQQEEITHLLSQIVDLQKKAKSYAVENEDLTQHLGAAKDAQRALTSELKELEEKHAECAEMLHEAQEELKNFRNKALPHSTPRRFHSLGLFPLDSLAAEIEGTMRKEIEMSDPEVEQQRLQPRRVFQTVRNVNQTVCQRSVASSHMNIPGSNQSYVTSRRSSCQSTSRSSVYEADGSEVDNRFNTVMDDSQRYKDSNKKPGTPGTPGSRDLQAALRRLALRRDSEQGDVYALVADNRELDKGGDEESGSEDSLVSLGTLHSLYSIYSNRSYLPEKLQIVKPLEGSVTLHAWQQLAQPHLGGILDARPGVVTKGFRGLELDPDEVHRLADLEEDEPGQHSQPDTSVPRSPGYSPPRPRNSNSWEDEAREDEGTSGVEAREREASSVRFPGKCVSHSSSTYTFSTCRIQRPLSLLSGSSLSSISRSRAQSSTSSTSTTSTSSTWLEERGLLPASPLDHARPNHPSNSSLSSLPSTTSECESSGLMLPADYSPWDPPYRTFLVSRPASSLLNAAEDSPSPTETGQLRLVDVLRKYSPPARSGTPGMVVVPRTVVSRPAGGLSCFSSGFR